MKKCIILIFLNLFLLPGCAHPGTEPLLTHVKNNRAETELPQPANTIQAPHPSFATQPVHQEWTSRTGLLRAQMEDWAAAAGYQIVWKVSRDYHLQSSFHFTGTYIEALKAFFNGMQQMGNSLRVTVYQGNNVVLISEE